MDSMVTRVQRELRETYAEDRAAQAVLDQEQRSVDVYKRHSSWYGSAFLVMQRRAAREGQPDRVPVHQAGKSRP